MKGLRAREGKEKPLLVRHRKRKRHHIADTTGFTDFRRAQPLNLIDTDNRVHRHKAAHHTFKLSLELLFAGVDNHLCALTEDEFLYFQKPPQITLIDLLGVHFEHLALVKENHLVDWSFTFGHGGRVNI